MLDFTNNSKTRIVSEFFTIKLCEKLEMASVIGAVSYVLTGLELLRPTAPILDILPGRIQGVVEIARNGRPYFSYLGTYIFILNRFMDASILNII